jgi:hypothetical protein
MMDVDSCMMKNLKIITNNIVVEMFTIDHEDEQDLSRFIRYNDLFVPSNEL